MHPNAVKIFEQYAAPHFEPGMKVLELGPCFPLVYRKRLEGLNLQWDTLDIDDSPNLTYPKSDPYRFPIPDETYDIVFSSQVMEHVPAPWKWLKEVSRVCKRGGKVITILPTNWGFHEFPMDCWRAYPDGMKALYQDAGLETEFAAAESLEKPSARWNWEGAKWIVKTIIGRKSAVPFLAMDTIAVGRRIA